MGMVHDKAALACTTPVEGELASCLCCGVCERVMDAFTCIGGVASGVLGMAFHSG